jgi:hypothetical protein
MPAEKAVKAENGGTGADYQNSLELCGGNFAQIRDQLGLARPAQDKSVLRITTRIRVSQSRVSRGL